MYYHESTIAKRLLNWRMQIYDYIIGLFDVQTL